MYFQKCGIYTPIARLIRGFESQEEKCATNLSTSVLKKLIQGGETTTVELKVAAPMSEFVVIFRAAPALSQPKPSLPPQFTETLWGEESLSQHDTSVQEGADKQEQRLVKAVQYVNEHGSITNALYRELVGVSDRTAHRDLETLVERGRLKGVGQKRARRYELP